ncbi:GlxA family transcriptional regulator [Pseudonocardia xinjiangensis]|uniref:GlxA family transcriptional regulator n=1 Tax=Pseudonocardia xinjiangensis TaxID=75289 RepID=UPI003D9263D4
MARDKSVVAVLMFDQAPLFEMSVPISVFGVDRSVTGAPRFTVLPVAGEPGALTSTGGVMMHAPHGLEDVATAGIVIVPAWRGATEQAPEPALRTLREAHADGALIVGLGKGAFVLAAAGLLDGRRAAIHWFHAPTLAASYPDVLVDPGVLYEDDGDVITSAGTAAGIDACLHVVRRLWGPAAAGAIARRMITPPQRSGRQAQYIDQPVPDRSEADELTQAMAYAVEHLDEVLDIEDMASHVHMSRRTFDRRFRSEVGISPLQWLLHQRVLRAQQLLEHTDLPVDTIARQVGLASAVSLRPPFHRFAGVAPQEYRNTFRPRARASEPTRADR